jgi:hypothetical protein
VNQKLRRAWQNFDALVFFNRVMDLFFKLLIFFVVIVLGMGLVRSRRRAYLSNHLFADGTKDGRAPCRKARKTATQRRTDENPLTSRPFQFTENRG